MYPSVSTTAPIGLLAEPDRCATHGPRDRAYGLLPSVPASVVGSIRPLSLSTTVIRNFFDLVCRYPVRSIAFDLRC